MSSISGVVVLKSWRGAGGCSFLTHTAVCKFSTEHIVGAHSLKFTFKFHRSWGYPAQISYFLYEIFSDKLKLFGEVITYGVAIALILSLCHNATV